MRKLPDILTFSPVILSAAKNPHMADARFFAALRMTGLIVYFLRIISRNGVNTR